MDKEEVDFGRLRQGDCFVFFEENRIVFRRIIDCRRTCSWYMIFYDEFVLDNLSGSFSGKRCQSSTSQIAGSWFGVNNVHMGVLSSSRWSKLRRALKESIAIRRLINRLADREPR